MRRYLAIALAVALLAAGCGEGPAEPDVEQERPVEVTGSVLPQLPSAGEDPAVGMAMPELSGASFDGTEISITNDGRPKVLLFLAHW